MPVDPFSYLFGLEQFGVKFGLDNMHAIVEALGRPHDGFRAVHVAGTNGKGSVTAMIESVLRAAGARTGRYTSPHLVNLSERIAVNGRALSESALRAAVSEVVDAVAALQQQGRLEVHPTFFEVTTAAAFTAFRHAGVEIAVCEVGLGGRLDATNVLSPMATAITSIGFDHQQYLGNTLVDIAAEKAGIIKQGVPVVLGELVADADAVIAAIAQRHESPIMRARDGVHVVVDEVTPRDTMQRLHLRTPARDYGAIELGLLGDHQVGNAIVAVRVLELLEVPGHTIGVTAVRQGFRDVVWPGRLERVVRPDGRTALLDAAHNPDGARTLAKFLAASRKRPLVFAAMRDKDADGVLSALANTVSAIIVTRASHPRSADPTALAAIARRIMPDVPCVIAESPLDALDAAWSMAPDIVIAGSIFLLGDIMKGWAA